MEARLPASAILTIKLIRGRVEGSISRLHNAPQAAASLFLISNIVIITSLLSRVALLLL